MKENKTWSSRDIAMLISMKDARYPLKYIATQLNITVNCVSKALSRYHKNYIKIDRKYVKKNKEDNVRKIKSISYAIEWFNKMEKNQYIYKITDNNYSYGIQGYLSTVSVMIIINKKRISKNLLPIELPILLLL